MKKSLILGMVGLVITVSQSLAQGVIMLDNYITEGPNVTYGTGWGALSGTGLGAGWTAGFYWAPGDVTGSIGPDPYGYGIPGLDFADGGLSLATGSGSTAQFYSSAFNNAGQFLTGSSYTTVGVPAGGTITVMLIAYEGATYFSADTRGHSDPFVMTVSPSGDPSPNRVGSFMPAFSILWIPEPSTFALTVLGTAVLLFRRRK